MADTKGKIPTSHSHVGAVLNFTSLTACPRGVLLSPALLMQKASLPYLPVFF